MLQAKVGTFLYFAFGSNVMRSRLTVFNPSAEFVTQAFLPDYKLDFRLFTEV